MQQTAWNMNFMTLGAQLYTERGVTQGTVAAAGEPAAGTNACD